MNIWKGSNKKTRKFQQEVVPTEDDASGAALPDVIAGLSLADFPSDGSAPMTDNPPTTCDGAMIGYPTQYTEAPEPRGRRRGPRSHQTFTPQGLGAAPTGFTSPQDLGVIPAPPQAGTSRRQDNFSGWQLQPSQSSEYTPNTQGLNLAQSASVNTTVAGNPGAIASLILNRNLASVLMAQDAESIRIRSVSSEPRAPNNGRNADRRERCSSASRNRQPRQRPNNHSEQQQTQLQQPFQTLPSPRSMPSVSSPTSSSPPMQQIQYQPTPTASVAPVNSIAAQPCPAPRVTETQETRMASREAMALPVPQNDHSRPGGSYGYQVPDLDALLTQASPTRPANLPMVLASSTRLHNMRITQEDIGINQVPTRPFLPLGIIVNAVFKTRDWLYVRTAHGAEGYVPYRVCLPLGILPPSRSPQAVSSSPSQHASPWEIRDSESMAVPLRGRQLERKPHHVLETNTIDSHHRSRPRGRRRMQHSEVECTNQTDHQKLQPSNPRLVPDSRPMRETFDPPSSSAPHLV